MGISGSLDLKTWLLDVERGEILEEASSGFWTCSRELAMEIILWNQNLRLRERDLLKWK